MTTTTPRRLRACGAAPSRWCSSSARSSTAASCRLLDHRVRARRPRTARRAAGHRRRQPHVPASGSRRAGRDAGVGRRGRAARLRAATPSSTALYARAAVFVFLSEYEGFGLTPLEALAAACRVVLDTPVAREVYGDARVVRARPATPTRWPRRARRAARPIPSAPRQIARARAGRALALLLGRRRPRDAGRARGAGTRADERALSIVIVSFNARADLEGCLRRSQRATRRRARDRRRRQRVDRRQRRGACRARGPACASSRCPRTPGSPPPTTPGFARAAGELLLLLNSDTIVPPGAIDALVARARARPARRSPARAWSMPTAAGAVVRPR